MPAESDTALVEQPRGSTLAPIPASPIAQLIYGLMIPLRGARLVLRDVQLRSDALLPALCTVAWCVLYAWWGDPPAEADTLGRWKFWLGRAYKAFVYLAPIPPFLFARHYARMAAAACDKLGLGPRDPWPRTFLGAQKKSLYKVILISVGLAPLIYVAEWLPWGAGSSAAAALGVGWTLHWMTVTALDGGRTLARGESVREAGERETRRMAWFGRIYQLRSKRFGLLLAPLRWFGRFTARMGKAWAGEVDLLERRPALAAGIAAGIASIVLVPGLNVVFRSALVCGAAGARVQLERADSVEDGPTEDAPGAG